MNTPSRLHPKFQSGVVVISGPRGMANSTLAFAAERPDQTAILIALPRRLGASSS